MIERFKMKYVKNSFIFLLLMIYFIHHSNEYVISDNNSVSITKSESKNIINKTNSNHLNHRKHMHHNKPNHDGNNQITNQEIRFNKKRCRYSDHEIEMMNKKNALNKLNKNQMNSNGGGTSYYDDDSVASLNSFNYRNHHVKQPKVRDQFNNRHHTNTEFHAETERIYADIGDIINMTCYFNTEEVDWHFKDKNLTTTVLAYGLELQVSKQILLNNKDQSFLNENSLKYDEYDIQQTQQYVFKYKVGSDKQFTHMLTLYVQGNQDEGIYQCIDSKSENPIKKTISLVLKNNSRALTSGFSATKSSILLVYLSFLFINSMIKLRCD